MVPGRASGNGLTRGAEALFQHRLVLARIERIGARHGEDVLAVRHRIVVGAGLSIAAVAARGFGFRDLQRIGAFDLGKLHRVLADPVKLLLLAWEALPHDVFAMRTRRVRHGVR